MKIKKYYNILIIFILGFIFGLIFILFIDDMDKLLISNEIKEYINIINNNSFSYANSFFDSFLENFILYFIIWCSGFIFILIPINYFFCFYKGFLLGFLISNMFLIYKIKGVIYSIIFIFPHEILSIIYLFILIFVITKFSKKFISILFNNDNYNLKKLIKNYFIIIIISIIVAIIISLSEVFINYFLVKLIV